MRSPAQLQNQVFLIIYTINQLMQVGKEWRSLQNRKRNKQPRRFMIYDELISVRFEVQGCCIPVLFRRG